MVCTVFWWCAGDPALQTGWSWQHGGKDACCSEGESIALLKGAEASLPCAPGSGCEADHFVAAHRFLQLEWRQGSLLTQLYFVLVLCNPTKQHRENWYMKLLTSLAAGVEEQEVC